MDNLNELPDIAAKIGIELRNQYVLGYSPQNQERDGKYRRVQVKLVQPRGLPPLRAFWRHGLLCSGAINDILCISAALLSLAAVALRGQQTRPRCSRRRTTGARIPRRHAPGGAATPPWWTRTATWSPTCRETRSRFTKTACRSRSRCSSARTFRSRMGLIIDNSGSMRDKRAKVEAAALALVKDSNPDDEVFVVNFNDEAFLDLPHGKDFTSDIKEMEEALTRIDSRGGTAMRDAIRMSIDHLKEKAHKDKKVLVVVTDGNDNSSVISLENLVKAAQQSEVLIYAVGLLSEEERREAKRAERALNALAEATGGEAFFPKE